MRDNALLKTTEYRNIYPVSSNFCLDTTAVFQPSGKWNFNYTAYYNNHIKK